MSDAIPPPPASRRSRQTRSMNVSRLMRFQCSSLLRVLRAPNLLHTDLRAQVGDRATAAPRVHRPADILAPGDQVEVDDRPPAAGRGGVERVLGLLRRARGDPAQTV